jgi:hypothetical protein
MRASDATADSVATKGLSMSDTTTTEPFDYPEGEWSELDKAQWAAFITARESGHEVEITEAMFWYWLEVLPPIFMARRFQFKDGQKVTASFGFAEGAEPITIFWEVDGRHFCRMSTVINPYA